AVAGHARRGARRRAARPVRPRRAVGQVLPDLLRTVGRVALHVAAEHQRRRLERIEELDLVVTRQWPDTWRGSLGPGAGDAVPLPRVVLRAGRDAGHLAGAAEHHDHAAGRGISDDVVVAAG